MIDVKTAQAVHGRAKQLYTRERVEQAIDIMAEQITEVLQDRNPLLLTVMQGGVVLTGGLLTRLTFPLQIDYLHVTRYHSKTTGSMLEWIVRPLAVLKNRVVLIVDDILDGGITLAEIVKTVRQAGAEKVYSAVLLDKKNVRSPEGLAHADFTGLSIDNHYVFGYGMDYHEYLRNATGIYAVDQQDYDAE
jgi:hypoxanthine phosphoribosyltransferase